MTFLPSLFGTLVAGAVLALVDEHLSAIAIGFASMAIGITVDYGIYVVYHLDNAARDRETAGKIVGRLVLPTFIGAMTIIAAFIVLACSPMRGYQQLGIFGAVGVLMSAAFALLVLPLLIPLPKRTDELPPLRFVHFASLQRLQIKTNRRNRRLQFMCDRIDEAVMLLVAPNFADQKNRIQNQSRHDRAKKNNAQKNPDALPPVKDDPSTPHRKRHRRQADSQREEKIDGLLSANDPKPTIAAAPRAFPDTCHLTPDTCFSRRQRKQHSFSIRAFRRLPVQ